MHLTARSDKTVAYVTNNKRLYSTFVLLKLTTDRHEASRGLFATAELLVSFYLDDGTRTSASVSSDLKALYKCVVYIIITMRNVISP